MKEKLKAIRSNMGITQQQMVDSLAQYAPDEFIDSGYISQFENGKREPSLPVLLAYSKLTRVSVNVLIDDELDLPKRFKPK
ncbi:MAG TPA: helix-turn-helix transcriptional regulator [Blastocatellia bacterium]|nr:helix-turn-helix transcriptional regulator [Blastocatellia bacterium]